MTLIRACCPACGEVEVYAYYVRVTVVGDLTDVRDGSTYGFVCPRCRTDVVKAADRRVVGLLASAGCHIDETGDRWESAAWVGRLVCGHDAAGRSLAPPSPGEPVGCTTCNRPRELVDVIVGRKAAA
jgi:hypothetical protein